MITKRERLFPDEPEKGRAATPGAPAAAATPGAPAGAATPRAPGAARGDDGRASPAPFDLVPRRLNGRTEAREPAAASPLSPASPVASPASPAGEAAPAPGKTRPFTVAELVGRVKDYLEGEFRFPVLVQGEASNVRRPRAGHLYFTLKDRKAQLRVVVFASAVAKLPFAVEDGTALIVRGRLTAYLDAGDLQLIADAVEPVGLGERAARLEATKKRLRAEGLFELARKRPLPRFPRTIGLVTSPTGAAIRDILSTIERRFPKVRVVVSSVRVSGEAAAPEVALAVRSLDQLVPCDVIIVARGGGSREELEAFDEEVVVRAIAGCRAPVVTGIGHETDVSLADLAADVRAPTPTAAAELVVPDLAEVRAHLVERKTRLAGALRGRLELARKRLEACARSFGFRAPAERAKKHRDRLAQIDERLARAVEAALERRRALVLSGEARLRAPDELLARHARRLAELDERLARSVREGLERRQLAIAAAAGQLDSLSPLKVLARGFSLTTRAGTTEIVRDAGALAIGDELETRLARGVVRSRVVSTGTAADASAGASDGPVGGERP